MMPLELESKLRIPSQHVMEQVMVDPYIADFAQEAFSAIDMEASYYDTPTHDLHARSWALRLRRENGLSVATLKTPISGGPAGLFLREEWFTPADTLEEAIDRLLAQGGPEELRAWSPLLTERCRLTYRRHRTVLSLSDTMIEVDFDSGQMEADTKTELFFEVECELLFGDSAPLLVLLNDWIKRYNLTADLTSKYERALRLIRSRKR